MTTTTMTAPMTSMTTRPPLPGHPATATTGTGQPGRPTRTPGPARPSPPTGGGWLHERLLLPLALERTKSRRPWILATVTVALAALNTVNGVSRYMENTDAFRAQDVTWQVVWGQGGLMWSIFFLPLLISVRAASLTRMEHEHDNWRRMATYGATTTTYTGKLALTTLFALFCQTAFLLLVLAASTALGFHLTLADLATMTTWTLLGTLGAMTIAAAQLLVGIHVPSLATTIMTGLGASVLGLAVLLVIPPLAPPLPLLPGHHRHAGPHTDHALTCQPGRLPHLEHHPHHHHHPPQHPHTQKKTTLSGTDHQQGVLTGQGIKHATILCVPSRMILWCCRPLRRALGEAWGRIPPWAPPRPPTSPALGVLSWGVVCGVGGE